MIIDWWNAYLDWATSAAGQNILLTIVAPFVAILIAGLIGAVAARAGISRLVTRQDREQKAAVIASTLAATRRAGAWAQLSLSEQDHLDYTIAESFAHIRMTPSRGSDLAAEWGTLKARIIKQKSMVGALAAETDIRDLEDWLILWHRHPNKATRHFRDDLETLRYTAAQPVASAAYQGTRTARVDTGDLQEILHR